MNDNIYLNIVKPIYKKMNPSDFMIIAEICQKLQEKVDEINERDWFVKLLSARGLKSLIFFP